MTTTNFSDAPGNGAFRQRELRRGRQYYRREAMERCNGRCVLCGDDHDLQCHHVYPLSLYPEKRTEVNGYVMLCSSCHSKIHSMPVDKSIKIIMEKING